MKSMAQMKYHFGMKIKIYPSDQQKKVIKKNYDAARFIYNEMVAMNKQQYLLEQVKVPIKLVEDRINQLKERQNARQLTNHFWFLNDKDIDSLAKANAIQNYHKAWNMYKKVHNAGVPKFKRKSYSWNYQTNCQYPGKKVAQLDNGTVRFLDQKHITIPKLGRLRVKGSHQRFLTRTAETRIGTVSIKKDNLDQFWLSMQLASDEPFVTIPAKSNNELGIDLNTENFLTTSDGEVVANPRYYRTIKHKLANAQRKLSRRGRRAKASKRKLRNSKNYQKQRLVVAKIQNKVMKRRQDFLHKLSTALIKNHDLVVAEELRSKNLLKNHALAMSIADAGWRTFLQMLTYKADLYGKTFVTVNPAYTTQTCHDCGFVMGKQGTQKLGLDKRSWTCPNCGVYHVRDHNAAQNILAKGIKKIA